MRLDRTDHRIECRLIPVLRPEGIYKIDDPSQYPRDSWLCTTITFILLLGIKSRNTRKFLGGKQRVVQ